MSDWDRPGFVEGFCNALARRIGRLEDSVAELEARIPAPEIVTRTTALATQVVEVDEYERLLRIEQLSARLLESSCPMGDAVRAANWERLANAVDRR